LVCGRFLIAQEYRFPFDQRHALCRQQANAQLGTLQIGQHGDGTPFFIGNPPHDLYAASLVLMGAMGEIDTGNGHPCVDKAGDGSRFIRSGS
jgi:hypothetical protein